MGEKAPRPKIQNEDKSFNQEALNRLGITEALATEKVTYRRGKEVYNVTLAEALDEPSCPLGDMVETAHEADPENGTINAFKGLELLGVKFDKPFEELAGKKKVYFRR